MSIETVRWVGVAVDDNALNLADGVQQEDALGAAMQVELAAHDAGPRMADCPFPHSIRHAGAQNISESGRIHNPKLQEFLDRVDPLGPELLVKDPILSYPLQPPDLIV